VKVIGGTCIRLATHCSDMKTEGRPRHNKRK